MHSSFTSTTRLQCSVPVSPTKWATKCLSSMSKAIHTCTRSQTHAHLHNPLPLRHLLSTIPNPGLHLNQAWVPPWHVHNRVHDTCHHLSLSFSSTLLPLHFTFTYGTTCPQPHSTHSRGTMREQSQNTSASRQTPITFSPWLFAHTSVVLCSPIDPQCPCLHTL